MRIQSPLPVRLLAVVVALTIAAACQEPIPTEVPAREVQAARNVGDGPTVTATKPSKSLRGVTLDVRVFGTGFDEGSTAQWAIDGVPTDQVVTNSVNVLSSTQLIANISISPDAEGGLYDVIVTAAGGGKPGIGTETFEINVEITDLGNLGGWQTGATAINESGQIAGYAMTPLGSSAFLWTNGVMKNLGTPAGFNHSRAEGLNNRGQVVGYSLIQRNGKWESRAWVWSREAGMQLLPGSEYSNAHAINDAGMIVGNARDTDGRMRVAVWINGEINFLPRDAYVAYDINARGQVVGDASPFHEIGWGSWPSAYVWSREVGLQYVSTLWGSAGSALGINDNGDVVGWGPYGTDDHMVHGWVSRRGAATSLGFHGGPHSVGMKVASNGLIVGRGLDQAVLWTANGAMVVLPGPEGTIQTEAYDVNSRGEAIGSAMIIEKDGTWSQRAIRWRVYK